MKAVVRLRAELAAAERRLRARRDKIERESALERDCLCERLLEKQAAVRTERATEEAALLAKFQEELSTLDVTRLRVCTEASCSRLYDPRDQPVHARCSISGCPRTPDKWCGCTVKSCPKCAVSVCALHMLEHQRACKRTVYTDDAGDRLDSDGDVVGQGRGQYNENDGMHRH